MTTNHSNHPLATPIESVGMWGYPIEDNITAYLDLLYEGKLYETLKIGYSGKDIILNLADAYAKISKIIFWEEDEYYDEALKAFPYLVSYILETELEINDLFNVSKIINNYLDDETQNGPEHIEAFKSEVQKLSAIFQQEKYKNVIYAELQDKSRSDYFELISIATDFYGEDEFELFFTFAKHQPVQVLFWSQWTFGMDEVQVKRFIEWARSYMPTDCLRKPVSRNHQYNKIEKAILERVLAYPENTLRNRQDRHDFIVWGLSSTDPFLPCNAAWLLEDMPLSEWPNGSIEIITELFDMMEPNWTSWIAKESRYVTIKERLEILLQKD
ncbi:hypothetical protein [Polaribacter sargassicola]|uniref:hypothetical protein n=1 Tax=Polaribacter sargassicola TaxID=2836891 RepID=UPI001F1D67C4|nr:hypothetical protein [Polaribacter sp. DS7-9]MCG1037654.1 hypothetical protein [Polaribacter sp. DS7-9]